MFAPIMTAPLLAENSLFKLVGEIFHPVFVVVATVLAAIYGVIPNYAIAIILLTILIMAILTPLTVKSTKSMMAMQRLQPEITRLRQKYKGAENREQLNQEMMRIYKEQGVNPAGSCLPMFLQMPFLIVLYDVIRGLSNTVVTTVNGQTVTRADPRYIPKSSRMYEDLVRNHGAMNSFGMNLALKPFSHHDEWYAYIPYFVLVLIAVVLQYVQMSQMSKRNPAAAQMNPQMQTMQKVMPVFFAYIYFLIPAAVVIYMIVSTGIRIGTQDLLFRTGIVQPVGERSLPSTRKGGGKSAGAIPAKSTDASGKPAVSGKPPTADSSSNGTKGPAPTKSGGGPPAPGTPNRRASSNGNASRAKSTNGNGNGNGNGNARDE